jgi:hypothetical protein
MTNVYHVLFHSHVAYGIVLCGHSSSVHDILLTPSEKGVEDNNFVWTPIPLYRPIFQELVILTVYSQYVLTSLVLLKNSVNLLARRGDSHFPQYPSCL